MSEHTPNSYKGFDLEFGDTFIVILIVSLISLIFIGYGVGATAILTTLACAAMGYEWFRFSTQEQEFDEPVMPIALVSAALPPFMAFASGPLAAIIVATLASVFLVIMGPRQNETITMAAKGIFAIGLGGAAFVYLRDHPEHGLALTAWLIFVVAATELSGRMIKGYGDEPAEELGELRMSRTEFAFSTACGGFAGFVVGVFYGEGSAIWVAFAGFLTAIMVVLASTVTNRIKASMSGNPKGSLFLGRGTIVETFDGLILASIFAAFLIAIHGAIFDWWS